MRSSGHSVDIDLLKDTLTLMCEFGFAERNSFGNGRTLYEHRHLGQHHDHMICMASGDVVEFTDPIIEQRQHEIAEQHGYELIDHSLVLYVRKKEPS